MSPAGSVRSGGCSKSQLPICSGYGKRPKKPHNGKHVCSGAALIGAYQECTQHEVTRLSVTTLTMVSFVASRLGVSKPCDLSSQ